MSVDYDGIRFDRPGHSSVRIKTNDGTVIYIDPWGEVIGGKPKDGDIIFVTHDDRDHYDPDAIEAVAKPGATVAAYEAVDTSALDTKVVDIPFGGEVTVDGVGVRSIPAYNEPDGEHVDEDGNPFHAEGEVIGLLMDIEETTIFFPSDTDFLADHESIMADVFIPPIGGHFTMDRHEAAEFAELVDPDLVLPVHYDTFESIETDVDAFVADVEQRGLTVNVF